MSHVAARIGPKDHGRRMTLDEFDRAEGEEGHLYELSRGVVTVMDIPNLRHGRQVDALKDQFYAYRRARPNRVDFITSGSECKILLEGLQSERHPDLAVYKSPPDDPEDPWATWVPDLVVEVVSPSSSLRDYTEKREEYLAFGVKEYWILDADKRELLVLRRVGGTWVEKVIRPPEKYAARLFPGLEFDPAAVFAAAGPQAD
jgi:Uma2 family endonuclease